MTEWSEHHVAAIGPFKLEPWNLCLMSDKMQTGRGQLGGPVEHLEGKGGESVVAILRFLCGSPRLCRLRTEGVGTCEQVSNIPIAYWCCDPSKMM
jgi:hypothetical protein